MRKPILAGLGIVLLALATTSCAQPKTKGENVEVRAGIRHDAFDRLLKKYVNEQGLVDYSGWKENAPDSAALRDYVKQFAAAPEPKAMGDERAATLVNAYNAITLQWMIENYPLESIWQLNKPFKAKHWEVGGKKVSLDDIEHAALRPQIGYKAHGVLVCAARSCPPLQRFAFTGGEFEAQTARAYREWLAREDLNQFLPNEKKVKISSIFKWFKEDFEKAGGIPRVLGMYAPKPVQDFAAGGNYEIDYLDYNWGLNDQGSHGRNYTKANLIWDNIF